MEMGRIVDKGKHIVYIAGHSIIYVEMFTNFVKLCEIDPKILVFALLKKSHEEHRFSNNASYHVYHVIFILQYND